VCKGLRREMMEDRTDKRAWQGARHGSVPGSKIQEE